MNRLHVLACWTALGVCALTACGSDDEGKKAGAPFSSSVSGKPLSQLTDAEMTELCANVGDYYVTDPDLKSGTCRFAGVGMAVASLLFGEKTDEQLRATCAEFESACLRAESTGGTQQGTCEKPGATCTATVAELEACINDSRDAVSNALLSMPSCETLKRSDIGAPTAGPAPAMQLPNPESCQIFQQKCPDAQVGMPEPTDSEGQ